MAEDQLFAVYGRRSDDHAVIRHENSVRDTAIIIAILSNYSGNCMA